MSSVTQNVKKVTPERQRQTAEFEERAREAEKAEGELVGLREQLERRQARQSHFKSFGKDRIEFPQSTYYRGYGQVELDPLRTRLTGNELAAQVQPKIDEIAGEIAAREQAIQDFLAA